MKITGKVVNLEAGEFIAKTGESAGEVQSWQRLHVMDEDDEKPSIVAVPKELHDVCRGLLFGDPFQARVRFVAGGSYEGRATPAKIALVELLGKVPTIPAGGKTGDKPAA